MKFYNILLLILLLLVTGCRSNQNTSESLMLLHYFTGNFAEGFDEFTKEVNEKSKKIKLISTPLEHEEFKINIRIQLDTENPPDLFSYWAGARTDYLVNKNEISPISSIFEDGIDKTVFDQTTIDACSYEGEMYILPLTKHYIGFFYNRTLFRKYGLTVPETWEELNNVARVLKQNSITPFALGTVNRWPAQFWFDFILLRTAGFDYRQDLMNKAAAYTDIEVLKTMDLWKNFLEKQFFNDDFADLKWDEAARKLTTGESAMTLMGSWAIPFLENRSENYDYGFFPFPRISRDIEPAALGAIDGILLSEGTKKKESALQILKYLANADSQKALNRKSGAIAPNLNVDDSIYSPLQLQIKELMEKNTKWAFNYDLATEPFISESGLDFFVEFLDNPSGFETKLRKLQDRISNNN